MKRLLIGGLVGAAVLGGLAGCFSFSQGRGPVEAFQFLASRNPGLGQNVTAVLTGQADPVDIVAVIPPSADSLNLVATFSLNTEAVVSVVSSGRPVVQQNGVTRNDFSSPVLYSVQVPNQKRPWRYRVTVRYAETNAALSLISIPEGFAMTPLFSPRVKSYTAEVPFSVTRVRIDARGQSTTLRNISIDGAGSGGASASTTVDFSSGASRRVSVETLAEDGTTQDVYTVLLKRLPADSNARLESLELVDLALYPAFSPLRTSYQAEVPFDAVQVVVKAKAQSKYATITLQTLAMVGRITSGRTALAARGIPSDRAGAVIDFSSGTLLPVIVAVTAEDGSVQEYLVEVRRAEPDHNNALAELAVSGGRMNPAFFPRTLAYAVQVPYSARQLVIAAKAQSTFATVELVKGTGTPALQARGALDSRDGMTVDLPASERIVLAVAVTAQDGRTAQYVLDVRRAPPDGNADLGALAVSAGVLSPIFSPRIVSYAVSLASSIASTRITASTASEVAAVAVEGSAGRPSASQTFTVAAAAGATETVNLIVTAEDGTQKMYRIRVSREAASDTNTRLARLQLAGAQINPGFDPTVFEYQAQLASNVPSVTLTALAENPAATIVVDGQVLARTGRVIALDPGASKTVVIDVTAQSGNVARTFLWLSRERSGQGRDTNARLSRLQLAGARLNPSFDPRVLDYQAQLASNLSSVTLTAAAESSVATVGVDGQPLGRTGRLIALDPGTSRTVVIDVTAESGNVSRTVLRLSREAGSGPTPPPGKPGGQGVSVTLDGVKIAERELRAMSASRGSIGGEARITVRQYRTNTVIAQGTAPVSTRMQGAAPVLSAQWKSPATKIDQGRLVEIEVAIPAGGSNWLHYTEAQMADGAVEVDVPFLLFSDNPRVAWPAAGRPVYVTGCILFSPRGPQKTERQPDAESFDLDARGQYGVEVTVIDPRTGATLGSATVWGKPGLPRGHVFTFPEPMRLPEGATVRYTVTAKAKNGQAWTATGSAQIWTTNLAYESGFEPVALLLEESLAPPR